MKKSKNVASEVTELVAPIIEGLGYTLWDVEYVKEGTEWFLRITIDSENGITINDCEAVHRAVDPVIDEHDPIENSYRLEVSSPGIERELRVDSHFLASLGEQVEIKLYTPVDGKRSLRGVLVSYEDKVITLSDDAGEHKINRADAAKVKTIFEF